MANPRDFQMRGQQAGVQSGAVIDEGLRSYMLRVYNLMAMGLAITGVAAFATSEMAISRGQLQVSVS